MVGRTDGPQGGWTKLLIGQLEVERDSEDEQRHMQAGRLDTRRGATHKWGEALQQGARVRAPSWDVCDIIDFVQALVQYGTTSAQKNNSQSETEIKNQDGVVSNPRRGGASEVTTTTMASTTTNSPGEVGGEVQERAAEHPGRRVGERRRCNAG